MNKYQHVNFKMFLAVEVLFRNSENIWKELHPVKETFSEFKTALQLFKETVRKEENRTPVTASVYLHSLFGLCVESVGILDEVVLNHVANDAFKSAYQVVRKPAKDRKNLVNN